MSAMHEQKLGLLVTTALEETQGSSEPLVYLGGGTGSMTSRKYKLVHHHCDDQNKLKRDTMTFTGSAQIDPERSRSGS